MREEGGLSEMAEWGQRIRIKMESAHTHSIAVYKEAEKQADAEADHF